MLFRYDLTQKIDLSKFKKHSAHYMSKMPDLDIHELIYSFALPVFTLSVEVMSTIAPQESKQITLLKFSISEIYRDSHSEIVSGGTIYPATNNKFKEIQLFQELFTDINSQYGAFCSDNIEMCVDKICEMIELLYKIGKLKIFV